MWDAPNMDMCLAEVIGSKATAATRPRMDALAAWFAGRGEPGDRLEACVFANVGAGQEAPMARWVANLRLWGWAVFVKPKQRRHDDIDGEMIRHIERRFRQGSLDEVIVASHDAKAFGPLLHHLAGRSVRVSVLGFREREFLASASSAVEFIDAEDVPGLFAERLPRTNLYDLPHGGRWFDPFAELEPLATSAGRHDARTQADHAPADHERRADEDADGDDPAGLGGDPDDPTGDGTAAPGDTRPDPVATLPLHGDAKVTALLTRAAGDDASADPSPASGPEAAAGTDTGTGTAAPSPSRVRVVELVADAVARSGTLTLQEVGELLREAIPGFSLESAGYSSVGELLETLQADASLTVARSANGHVLLPLTAPASLDEPGTDGADETEPDSTAPPEPGSENEPASSNESEPEPEPVSETGATEPSEPTNGEAASEPDPATDPTPDDGPEPGTVTVIDLVADAEAVPSFDEFRPRDAVVLDLTEHRAESGTGVEVAPGPSLPPTPPAAHRSGEDDRWAGTGGVGAQIAPGPSAPPAAGPNPIYRLFGFDPQHPR